MILTFPVMADHTLSVLSSDPDTMRLPQNWRHVMTWSSWPFRTLAVRIGRERQFISMMCCRMYAAFQGDEIGGILPARPRFGRSPPVTSMTMFASLHFSFHRRLSSARKRQLRQVWAARRRSFGSRYDRTCKATSLGSNEMKSRWNCGSITFIMCRTWVGSQRSISMSTATRRSTGVHRWKEYERFH